MGAEASTPEEETEVERPAAATTVAAAATVLAAASPAPVLRARSTSIDEEPNELVPKIQLAQSARNRRPSNEQPTAVPAPQKQFFGVLGQRHCICINGLPNNGKAFVARELGWYLEFFHGARVEYFEVDKYANCGSREANAYSLLDDVQSFLLSKGGIGAPDRHSTPPGSKGNLDPAVTRSNSDGRLSAQDLLEAEESFRDRKSMNTDSGRVAIVMPPRMSAMAGMSDDEAKEVWKNTWSCTNALDRDWIRRQLKDARMDCKVMFIELELTDPELIRQHMDAAKPAERQKLESLRSWYECSFTPLGQSASSEAHLSFLRYRNFRDMQTHGMHGYLRMRVAQFLSVLRPWKHTIYLSRHGESTYNVEKKLGGDPGLSPAGDEYARRLGVFTERCIQTNVVTGRQAAARLWTSSLQRTELTAAYIPHPSLDVQELEPRTHVLDDEPGMKWAQMRHRVYRNLDEIYAGTYDGMTEAQIAATDQRFGKDRKVDKLATRYPHGESYLDLITRLEPLIHELHSFEEPLLIVSHQATLRVLRAYLLRDRSKPREKCPSIDIPQHTVMKVTWDGWNFEVKPSPLEARMKAKQWPPPPGDEWGPDAAHASLGKPELPIGSEEWFWLGPDPKRSDGQANL